MLPEYLSRSSRHTYDIPEQSVDLYPNAFNLINEGLGRSVRHENACFTYLQQQIQDGIVIGPHLIDYMFGKTPQLAGLVRPDALLLNEQGTILTGMAEFKSGKSNGFTKKLDGFSILLEKLRQQPHMLPEMLFFSVGEHVDTPAEITIPPDEKIEVTFLAPFEGGVLYDASTSPFPVTYFRIPLPNSEAA